MLCILSEVFSTNEYCCALSLITECPTNAMSPSQSPKTVPQSPKAGHLRRSLYKQSPAKTPLREVLKARWGFTALLP